MSEPEGNFKEKLKKHPITESISYMVRWTLFAFVAGGCGGVFGGIFSYLIRLVTGVRAEKPWAVAFLPVIGIIIVTLYKITGEEHNRGTNMVISAISEGERVTLPTGPLIFISTILSHLGGASVGREGAALQLGGWMGAWLARFFKFNEENRRAAVLCGMSAVFAALFGTPVAAALFCIEVISVGAFYYSALVPCVFSSFVGYWLSINVFGGHEERWKIAYIPEISPSTIGLSILLGLLCALVSILLVVVINKSEHYAAKFIPNPFIRAAVCGAAFAAITLIIRTQKYTGTGTVLITEAIGGRVDYPAFIIKLAFTALALAGGFKGGEIVPTLSIGATFGALFGALTGFPVSLSAACGMVAVFAGATNCPIASVLIAMEMFHGEGLPFFAISVALSFVLSGYYGLYGSQRFAFSKTKPTAIKRKSNK